MTKTDSVIRISVRELIDFVLRSGDICSGYMGSSRMVQGIKGHQVLQRSLEGYQFEIPVSHRVERDGLTLEVTGRIDRLIEGEDGYTVDEIKTTKGPLDLLGEDPNSLHWAQAKCYAYFFGVEKGLSHIHVQLTYYRLDSGETKALRKKFHMEELESFFYGLVNAYLDWVVMIRNWTATRNDSISRLDFPYPAYRRGQREFAVTVFRTVREGGRLFAQAPTGIGKTMAALFPAVKAMGEGLVSKIFYLTAKTVTRTVAEKAFELLREKGLRLKVLTLMAKDKICLCPEGSCDPEGCEYAGGHYDRVGNAIAEIFHLDFFSPAAVMEAARRHRVCPFEFSLDLALWADCVICDYNYAFDPRVFLRRFFTDQSGDYCFLIDEAHNLVDRAREMFSAELYKRPFLELKRETKMDNPRLSRALDKLNAYFIQLRKRCEETGGVFVDREPPKALELLLEDFAELADEWLSQNRPAPYKERLLELYFNVLAFQKTMELYDERYVSYCERTGDDIHLKLFCLDPSYLLGEAFKRARSVVLFSATLSPMDYFIKTLGGDEESYRLKLLSPFPRENLCVLVADRISTRYRMREFTFAEVADAIARLVSAKKGNYLVYFPSYSYMNEVFERYCLACPSVKVIRQRPGMEEKEREAFLEEFSEDAEESMVAFAVMGGLFGEGIDLAGECLSGACIVGVGLPQVCLERNILRDYYEEKLGMGFEYAYIYPGINKVMQAVGRVIRTERDRGAVLLIDERFSLAPYRNLLPEEWQIRRVRDGESITKCLKEFWEE